MNIKNLVVKNKKVYLDILIRELIKLEISYVLVDNYELHFENNIIRLYDLDEIMDKVIKDSSEITFANLATLDDNINLLSLERKIQQPQFKMFKQVDEIDLFKKEDKPKYTKKMIKQQNRFYSNKINSRKK